MENNEVVTILGDINCMFDELCAKANEVCKAIPVREIEPGRRVFVPKPELVGSFTTILVDFLFNTLVGKNTNVYITCKFRGHILTFPQQSVC